MKKPRKEQIDTDVTQSLLHPDEVEYIDFDHPETDIHDEMYATKCGIERQLNLINGRALKTGSGKDYKTTLKNILNVIEEDQLLSNLELDSENIAAVKEKYGENVKRKQRFDVVDSLFPTADGCEYHKSEPIALNPPIIATEHVISCQPAAKISSNTDKKINDNGTENEKLC